jgi:hypothetical protein
MDNPRSYNQLMSENTALASVNEQLAAQIKTLQLRVECLKQELFTAKMRTK